MKDFKRFTAVNDYNFGALMTERPSRFLPGGVLPYISHITSYRYIPPVRVRVRFLRRFGLKRGMVFKGTAGV